MHKCYVMMVCVISYFDVMLCVLFCCFILILFVTFRINVTQSLWKNWWMYWGTRSRKWTALLLCTSTRTGLPHPSRELSGNVCVHCVIVYKCKDRFTSTFAHTLRLYKCTVLLCKNTRDGLPLPSLILSGYTSVKCYCVQIQEPVYLPLRSYSRVIQVNSVIVYKYKDRVCLSLFSYS